LYANTDESVQLALENSPLPHKTNMTSVQDFKKFLDESPRFGFLWDYGHSIIAKWSEQEILDLGNRIVQMHLHGWDGESDHIPVQKSITDYSFLARPRFKRIPLILEYYGSVTEKQVLESKEFLKKWL
jgi:sugar phosphate isomerase/epimerase